LQLWVACGLPQFVALKFFTLCAQGWLVRGSELY
jgi:hypothetical protein